MNWKFGLYVSLSVMSNVVYSSTQLSLKSLLDLKTTVASSEEMSVRESPGILTVLTQEQIKNSGAQDLTEILEKIPGFELGTDVQGVEGLAIRGMWANEGKVLLLVDGMEVNEHAFSSIWLGGHYPIASIKKIEIIRGPGSALYGGYAELGVINIVTMSNEEQPVLRYNQQLGVVPESGVLSRTGYNFGLDQSISGLNIQVNADLTKSVLANDSFVDIYGNETVLNPFNYTAFVNGKLKYKNFEYYGMYDYIELNRTVSFYSALNDYAQMYNNQQMHDLKYNYALNNQFKIQANLHWRLSMPWETPFQQTLWDLRDTDGESPYAVQVDEKYSDFKMNWDVVPGLSLILGNKTTHENAKIQYSSKYLTPNDPIDRKYYTLSDDSSKFELISSASYMQFIHNSTYGNVICGFRHEYSSQVDQSFVPRFAYTKAWDKFHVKLLASKAFRAPSIENFVDPSSGMPKIKPENTTVLETELGYALNENWLFTANAFDIKISKPIMYGYSSDVGGFYENHDQWGSKGVESAVKFVGEQLSVDADYSLSLPNNNDKDIADYYGVPGHLDYSVGIPMHKARADVNYHLGEWSVGGSALWRGAKYVYDHVETVKEFNAQTGDTVDAEYARISKLNPSLLLGLHVRVEPNFWEGSHVELGAKNILDQAHVSAQPYNGWKNPEPRLGRNFYLSMGVQF